MNLFWFRWHSVYLIFDMLISKVVNINKIHRLDFEVWRILRSRVSNRIIFCYIIMLILGIRIAFRKTSIVQKLVNRSIWYLKFKIMSSRNLTYWKNKRFQLLLFELLDPKHVRLKSVHTVYRYVPWINCKDLEATTSFRKLKSTRRPVQTLSEKNAFTIC